MSATVRRFCKKLQALGKRTAASPVNLDICIAVWDVQFGFTLPHELLLLAGERELNIKIIAND